MDWRISVDTRLLSKTEKIDPKQPIILSERSLLCLTALTTKTFRN